MVRMSTTVSGTGSAPYCICTASDCGFFLGELPSDDALVANGGLDHWGRKHDAIQHNGHLLADVGAGVVIELVAAISRQGES